MFYTNLLYDHGYVMFVVITIRSSSLFMTYQWGLYQELTRRVPHVVHQLLSLQEHQNSHPVFSEVRIALSLCFCVMFCRSLFVLLSLFFSLFNCLSLFRLRLLVTPLVSLNFCPLYCLSLFGLRLLVTPLVSLNFCPLYCLSLFGLRLLITPLLSSNLYIRPRIG